MNSQDIRDLEQRSSAVTLSDMEVFIFPELMYSLVLANLMSPRIWRWREDPWFAGLKRMNTYRRIQRLKQHIIDHYVFNLDLETWGLTTKPRELARFQSFIDPGALAQSNALFGYEGDKYYFDIGIRTHFGLDRFTTDTIPYWKTETVEAMDAFVHRPGFTTGAGECVSLATLYAAALHIVAGVPLRDIFLMATPLHSQNFVDIDEGLLINNRRLVTKNMWVNGSALSSQARRALENERVTIVSHVTGHIHTVFDRATIDPAKATPSSQIRAGALTAYESTETTHFSIVDAAGNAVSVTYTLNGGFGSGVTATGLGFLLNNEMDDFSSAPGHPNLFGLLQGEADAIAPHKTPLSAMTPTIVTKDGKLYMVVGSPGGPTIITAVMQVILNVLDFHMNMQQAVDQSRIHHQWMPDSLSVENTVSPDTIELLKQRGHTIRLTNAMGEVAAIRLDGQWIEGASDGRVEGNAKGY